jgi:DNA replication and repair protein RecF
MPLQSLHLTNFRSYSETEVPLSPAVTLVVGPNASGKTNLLESLYVLASTKSFRAKDRDLVRHGSDFFRIAAKSDKTEYAIGLRIHPNLEKRVTHDGVKRPQVQHIGQIQATLFEPTDLELIAGSPKGRRRYLDYILSQTDRSYLRTLQAYQRVLKQRNALLEGFAVESVRGQIFSWDLQLSQLASEIFAERQRLIGYLNERLTPLYSDIAGETIPLRLTYISSIEDGDYGDIFLEALTKNLPRDLATGFTTIGPHREDFSVTFNDSDIMAVASRGEVRTLVLALKLAELTYSDEQTGIRPLLLLDDVFSELDHDRRTYLLQRLEGYQTVITTTDADAVVRELSVPHSIIYTGSEAGVTHA